MYDDDDFEVMPLGGQDIQFKIVYESKIYWFLYYSIIETKVHIIILIYCGF